MKVFAFFSKRSASFPVCARPPDQPRAQAVLFCKKEPKNFHDRAPLGHCHGAND
jgi:hypothetical protein